MKCTRMYTWRQIFRTGVIIHNSYVGCFFSEYGIYNLIKEINGNRTIAQPKLHIFDKPDKQVEQVQQVWFYRTTNITLRNGINNNGTFTVILSRFHY